LCSVKYVVTITFAILMSIYIAIFWYSKCGKVTCILQSTDPIVQLL